MHKKYKETLIFDKQNYENIETGEEGACSSPSSYTKVKFYEGA